jgi:hypothetical protein
MSTRNGKIAWLSCELREEVNKYLHNGKPGKTIVAWLNSRPDVQRMLRREFEGVAISEQNLSEWRQGGYAEWAARVDLMDEAEELALHGEALDERAGVNLADRLTSVLAARYASLMLHWDGEPGEKFEARLKVLGNLNRQVLALQRGVHRTERMEMQLERQQWMRRQYDQEKEEKTQQAGPYAMTPAEKSLEYHRVLDLDPPPGLEEQARKEREECNQWQAQVVRETVDEEQGPVRHRRPRSRRGSGDEGKASRSEKGEGRGEKAEGRIRTMAGKKGKSGAEDAAVQTLCEDNREGAKQGIVRSENLSKSQEIKGNQTESNPSSLRFRRRPESRTMAGQDDAASPSLSSGEAASQKSDEGRVAGGGVSPTSSAYGATSRRPGAPRSRGEIMREAFLRSHRPPSEPEEAKVRKED